MSKKGSQVPPTPQTWDPLQYLFRGMENLRSGDTFVTQIIIYKLQQETVANRILVATLFPGSDSNPNLMTVSPNNIQLKHKDDVYFVVDGRISGDVTGDLTFSSASPFGKVLKVPIKAKVGTPVKIGTVGVKGIDIEYTISLTCDKKQYSEDPEMQIKG